MKKITFTVIAVICFAFPALLSAAEDQYFSISGGLGFVHNSDAETGDIEYKDAIEYKEGYALEAALGRKAGAYRGELAVGYSISDADKLFGDDMDDIEHFVNETLDDWDLDDEISNVDLSVTVVSVMANGYTDFELYRYLTAYLMGGLGYAYVDAELSFTNETDDLDMEYSEDGKGVFAWQVGSGIGLKVTDGFGVDLGYRYFVTDDAEILDAKMEYSSSKVMLGMRFVF